MTATLLVQIAAKATLVLLGGLGLTRAMSHASAASRHLVWVLTLAAALAVPAMHWAGPVWTLAVLPQAAATTTSSDVAAVAVAPVTAASVATEALAPLDTFGAEPLLADDIEQAELLEPSAPLMTSTAPAQPAPVAPMTWGEIAVGVWLVGVALMLLRLAIGVTWASLTVRAASELPDTGWQDSLDESAAALGLTRRVGLRVSEKAAVPMATGLWRAVVLLPPSAIDWPADRQRVVLQHELAHVKRRDCLLQALAQCVAAIHWFNPFAHVAVARLRVEQERACDDMVIQVGTDARSYAHHLFEIARSFRAASFPSWVAMSMARPSQLEGRMLAILDEACVRCAPSASIRAALLAATVIVALPLGALRLAAQVTPELDQSPTLAATASDDATQQDQDFQDQDFGFDDRDAAADVDARFTPSVEVVHGDLADVDLLELTPSLAFGDAIQAGQFKDSSSSSTSQSFKESTTNGVKESKWITIHNGVVTKGAAGAAAAQNPAVSDETRKRVADALITALNDDNPQVRQEALTSLASMRDERAIPGLIRALSDPTTDVRMRALSALAQFDTMPAADGVLAALKDRNADVRVLAARQLASLVSRGKLSDAKYVDAVTGLLKDDNADVREQAVVALGRMRVTGAAASITQALRDSSPDVREQAARALGQLGSADAVPALIPLLKDPAKDVREQAANALGNLADPRAIDALTAALKDAEPSVREEAARALGQIARGQRRGVRPGAPVPPLPPLPPRAFIDQDRIREIEERARDAAERARDGALRMRDFELRFAPFDLFDVPVPAPAPAPAPAPRAPAAPAPPTPR